MYSSTPSLTSALYGVGGQRHAPAALPPGMIRCPFYGRRGGPRGRFGRARNISSPTGVRSQDRPARSESLYRLSYPGPAESTLEIQIRLPADHRCDILRVLAQVITWPYRVLENTYSLLCCKYKGLLLKAQTFLWGNNGDIVGNC